MSEYDASRLANFGRDTSRTYAAFVRSEKKLTDEINEAIRNEVKPIKIAHDILGRCHTQEARIDLLSCLVISANMGRIPKDVVEPFKEGILAKRI